jgi:lipid-A-disaccharide synthase
MLPLLLRGAERLAERRRRGEALSSRWAGLARGAADTHVRDTSTTCLGARPTGLARGAADTQAAGGGPDRSRVLPHLGPIELVVPAAPGMRGEVDRIVLETLAGGAARGAAGGVNRRCEREV